MKIDTFKAEYGRWYNTFLGIRQRHTHWLYKVIDDVLNENKQITGIIETGTGAGALSVFLGLECYERRMRPLITYDIKNFAIAGYTATIYKRPRLFDLLKIKFIVRDCFHEDSIKEITEYAREPILFMCDGGNKLGEFRKYVELLKEGSIIASHDWQSVARSKITQENIKDLVEKYKLKPLHEEEWDSPPDYIKTCFWRKEHE